MAEPTLTNIVEVRIQLLLLSLNEYKNNWTNGRQHMQVKRDMLALAEAMLKWRKSYRWTEVNIK